jgi:osmoprotectant transport system permease protein
VTPEVISLIVAHLRLVLIAIAAGSVLGLGIGIVAARNRLVERGALGAASLIQAVPALALLAAMVPLFAWLGHTSGLPISGIGELPALVALTLYAILPIARGVVVGIRSIDPAVEQAALAVGMTDRQRFRLVDRPLAMPATLAGLRTATAWTVGMATLATPIGARSLGNLIFSGLQTRHYDQVAIGCAAAAIMAIVLDALLALAERRARGRHPGSVGATVFGTIGVAAALAVVVGLAPSAALRPIRIGAKSFTEQLILAEVLRCAVGDASPVEVRPSLGTTVAFDAVRSGELDAYVEYTGTAWSTIMKRTAQVDRNAMRAEVTAALQSDFGVRVVANLGFENAYALVVSADNPAQRISDLGAASSKLFGGDYEFFERSEWQALRTSYGLAPRETRAMDPSLLYDALATAAVDVIAGYTTDGRVDALHLRVLADDHGAIPPYDAIVVISERLAREQPEIAARLAALEGSIDAATMRRWNAAVDSGSVTPAAAVREHAGCRKPAVD